MVEYDSQKIFPLDKGLVQKTVQTDANTLIAKYVESKPTELPKLENPPAYAENSPSMVYNPNASKPTNLPAKEDNSPPLFDFSTSSISLSDLKAGDKVLIEASNDFRQDPAIAAKAIVLVNGLTDQELTNALNTSILLPTPMVNPIPPTVTEVPVDIDEPSAPVDKK